MASVFGHALVSSVIASCGKKAYVKRTLFLCLFLSILPDFDVVAFRLSIPYESIWGHRGFTHSIFFSFVAASICTKFFYPKIYKSIFTVLFLSGVSHSILDALTNGGLGVAFFFPLENSRYFFPWTPIEISPVGIKNFFTERGFEVIKNELLWLGMIAVLIKASHLGWNFFARLNKKSNNRLP